MKKLLIIFFVFLIISSGIQVENNFSLLNYFSGDYTVYTSNENSINLGFCYMGKEHTKDEVVGESIKIENLEIGSALKTLSANVVKTEYLDDGTTVIYAYSSLINESVKIENKNVNLQIAERNNIVTIGWPLILGSF